MSILTTLHLDDPASLKRAIASILGTLCLLAVNPFLESRGIPPVSDATIGAVAAVLVGFLLQSGANSIAAKQANAKVATAALPSPAMQVSASVEAKP